MARTKNITVEAQKAVTVTSAVAAAIFAYRQNGNDIRKWSKEELKSNRELIDQRLEQSFSDVELQEAHDMIKELASSMTFKQLKRSSGTGLNTFEQAIGQLLAEFTVPVSKLNIVAYVPKLYDQMIERREKQNYAWKYEINSQYLPQNRGEKIEFDLTVIDLTKAKHPGTGRDYYRVYGHTETGHLVLFYTDDKERTVNGKYTGRIKQNFEIEHRNQAKVTSLNYVRKAKDKKDSTTT